MVTFQEITLEDKDWINELLSRCHYMSCEYCFGNHFIWKKAYDEQVARIGDYYTVRMVDDEGERGTSFLFPAGSGPLKPVIEELLDYCEQNGQPFRLHSMPQELVPEMERLFPGLFEFATDRDYADYIYNVEDLVNLSGKKYHGKRNHIARFKEGDWAFEPLNDGNFDECMEMNRIWCEQNDCGRDESIKAEQCAVRRSFRYYSALDFFGGLLRRDGRVVAYTIGERLNSDTVVVHIEKAFADVQGAYPAINREFLANLCRDYRYVNREEDLGVEGLRRAKLSYQPAILLPKYGVRIKDEARNTKSCFCGCFCPKETVAECVCRQ